MAEEMITLRLRAISRSTSDSETFTSKTPRTLDDPQDPGPVRRLENAGAGVDLQMFQWASLGVTGIAGLAAGIQPGADLLLRGGEHDLPLLVEDPNLPDALLLEAAQVANVPVQVVPAVFQHVVVGTALDGLAKLVGTARALRQQLGRVSPEYRHGHPADGQSGGKPCSDNQAGADSGSHGSGSPLTGKGTSNKDVPG